jgi:hypothetical protein
MTRYKYDEPSKCPDLTGLVFLENKQSTYWKVCGKADKAFKIFKKLAFVVMKDKAKEQQ